MNFINEKNSFCLCQTEIEDIKKQRERLEKQMGEVQAENKKLVEPLQKAQEQVAELQRQLFSYDKDKALLAVNTFIIVKLIEYLKMILILINKILQIWARIYKNIY